VVVEVGPSGDLGILVVVEFQELGAGVEVEVAVVEETESGGLESLVDEEVQVAGAGASPVEGQVVGHEVLLEVVRAGADHEEEVHQEVVEQSSSLLVVVVFHVKAVEQSSSLVVVVDTGHPPSESEVVDVGHPSSVSAVVVTVTVEQSSIWGSARTTTALSTSSAGLANASAGMARRINEMVWLKLGPKGRLAVPSF
jgi:hypothetical protein